MVVGIFPQMGHQKKDCSQNTAIICLAFALEWIWFVSDFL